MSYENIKKFEEDETEFILEPEEIESSEEPPVEEWSSLICLTTAPEANKKRTLNELDLFEAPSSEEICAVYLPISDSSIYRHPMYPYPPLHDPGIKEALLESPLEITYKDDGQDLYIELCKQMNEAPCTLFHRSLLRSRINLSYYCVSPMGFRAMAMALRKNKFVKAIDFTNNFISLDGCFHFGDILLENDTLVEMNFSGCRMGAEGLKRLVANFPDNKSLRKIDLSRNELQDDGITFLAHVISKGSKITHIDLSYNMLTEKSAENLANAIELNKKLICLNFSWNQISVPRYLEMLALQLKENSNFTELDISWNSLSNRFTKAICIILEIPNLKVLKLNNNDLNESAITSIATTLPEAKKLVTLDLSDNPLSITDAKTLLRSMGRRAVKLKKLLLDNINVDEQFVLAKDKILCYSYRKDAVITHGYVLQKNSGTMPDLREIVLKRAQFLCSKPNKKARDVGVLLLEMAKFSAGEPMTDKQMFSYFKSVGEARINLELCESLCFAFPGRKAGKTIYCNIAAMTEYIKRLFPNAVLPPTPPPSLPPSPPPESKKSAKVKGKDPKGKNVKGKDVKDKAEKGKKK